MTAHIIDFQYGGNSAANRMMISELTQRAIRENHLGYAALNIAANAASERLWGSRTAYSHRDQRRMLAVGTMHGTGCLFCQAGESQVHNPEY